jgi:hypothetical protein
VFAGKIGPDPRNFNQRVSLGRNDLLIRTFLNLSASVPKADGVNIYLGVQNSVKHFKRGIARVMDEVASACKTATSYPDPAITNSSSCIKYLLTLSKI